MHHIRLTPIYYTSQEISVDQVYFKEGGVGDIYIYNFQSDIGILLV